MLTSVNRNRKSCELWRILFTRRKNQCPLDFLNIIEILQKNDKVRGRYANYIFAEFTVQNKFFLRRKIYSILETETFDIFLFYYIYRLVPRSCCPIHRTIRRTLILQIYLLTIRKKAKPAIEISFHLALQLKDSRESRRRNPNQRLISLIKIQRDLVFLRNDVIMTETSRIKYIFGINEKRGEASVPKLMEQNTED